MDNAAPALPGKRGLPLSVAAVIGAVTGLALWLGIGASGHVSEPWDSPEFFLVGLPAMALTAFILGLACPRSSWLAGGSIILLLPFALVLGGGVGPLLVVGFMMFGVLAAVLATIARGAAFMRELLT